MIGSKLPSDLMLWRLTGPASPPITHALTVGEAARAAEIRVSEAVYGTTALPDCLHGPSTPGEAYRHAFRLALDLDGDGRIDHLARHVPGGLCADNARILAMTGTMRVHGVGRYNLVAAIPDARLAGPQRKWRAVTPFVAPRHSWRTGSAARRPDGTGATRA